MDIYTIKNDPVNSLYYLERYINDGSPSGFTEKYRTSSKTDPFGKEPYFHLYAILADKMLFDIYGEYKETGILDDEMFFIHPDMINHPEIQGSKIIQIRKLLVVPTASARTVQIINFPKHEYIKLHYDGIIGRINRRLIRRKVINGPEMSNIILNSIQEGKITSFLSILHEKFAKIFKNPSIKNPDDHWGMIWREFEPKGNNASKIKFLIPLFSIWSKDRLQKKHEIILNQLIKIWGSSSEKIITDYILKTIIDVYFDLICNLGLQNELNAQNILLGFNDDYRPVSVVMRDLMGIEKDITIRKSLGLNIDFDANNYKIIRVEDENNKWQIRHSFSFDFKLSLYVILPIIECGADFNIFDKYRKIEEIKIYIKSWLDKLPPDYFPLNRIWYSHRKELLVNGKVFIENKDPLLR